MAAVMYNMRTPALPIRLDVTNEQIKEYNSSTISTSTWDISDTHRLTLLQANGDWSFPACSSKKGPARKARSAELDDQNGQDKPIYYASRILKEAEARYTKADKKSLAL